MVSKPSLPLHNGCVLLKRAARHSVSLYPFCVLRKDIHTSSIILVLHAWLNITSPLKHHLAMSSHFTSPSMPHWPSDTDPSPLRQTVRDSVTYSRRSTDTAPPIPTRAPSHRIASRHSNGSGKPNLPPGTEQPLPCRQDESNYGSTLHRSSTRSKYSEYPPSSFRGPSAMSSFNSNLAHASSYTVPSYPATPRYAYPMPSFTNMTDLGLTPQPLKIGLQKKYAGGKPVRRVLPGAVRVSSTSGSWLHSGTLRAPLSKPKKSFWGRTKSFKVKNEEPMVGPTEEISGWF